MPEIRWESVVVDVEQAQHRDIGGEGDRTVRCVVVAGSTVVHQNLNFSHFVGVPILAEPSASLRNHPNAVVAHPIVLSSQLRAQINRVVVVGHPTLTREISALLADPNVEVYILDDVPTYADVAGRGQVIDVEDLDAVLVHDQEWLVAWQAASQAAENHISSHATDFSFATIGREISKHSMHLPLVVGASSIIREINLYAPLPAPPVHANRGLAGIDGTMSSALGIALATGKAVRVALGDVTFVHDLGALVHTAHQQS